MAKKQINPATLPTKVEYPYGVAKHLSKKERKELGTIAANTLAWAYVGKPFGRDQDPLCVYHGLNAGVFGALLEHVLHERMVQGDEHAQLLWETMADLSFTFRETALTGSGNLKLHSPEAIEGAQLTMEVMKQFVDKVILTKAHKPEVKATPTAVEQQAYETTKQVMAGINKRNADHAAQQAAWKRG